MQRQDVVPDVITCNALISACEKGKQPDRAPELVEAMQWQRVKQLRHPSITHSNYGILS